MRSTLHGRAGELAAIRGALDGVRRGASTAFALVGEPGIGKSRLADEVATHAREAGFTVCWGRAWETGGAPAYWAWRGLLDGMPGAHASELDMLWGRSSAAATDPDQARFLLYEAVASTLRAAAAKGPLVCVLDDLHAADVPSLELAAFATRHLRAHPILWICTWRDAEASACPGKDVIAAIARSAQTMPLKRLSADESRRLLDDVARDREASLDEPLFRATAGNPLFLLETIAWITARGIGGLPGELEHLPLAEGVATVVRARTATLSPAALRALEAASLLGRDVSGDRWAEATGLPEESLRQRSREIVATGILVETGPSRWSFSHDLVREAIGRRVPEELARAAHHRVALALDRRVEAGDRTVTAERLHHALAALGDVGPERAITWAIEAADDARAQCAYEPALAMVQRAIAAIGPLRATADPRLELALGRAHLDLGDVAAGRHALHAAIDATRASGDARTHALAVLAYGSRYVLGDIHDDLVRMIDAATAALGDTEVALRARLLARKAAALTPAADPDEVLGWAREAYHMVAGSPDELARLEVCVGVGSAFGDFAHPRERIPVNETLVALARAHKDRALELRGVSRLVTDHIEAGDFRRADALLVERDELARALKQPRFGWMAPLFRSMRAMPEGRFDDCRAAVADAEALGCASGDANAARCVAVHRLWLFLLEDDAAALRAHEPQVLDVLRSMPPSISSVVRAILRLRAGDRDAARAEAAAIAPSLPHCAVNTMATLAEVVAEVGPPELARALLERLRPHADTFATWGLFGLTCGLPIATALGRLEAAYGDPARARAYFDDALARTTALGAHALTRWTRRASEHAAPSTAAWSLVPAGTVWRVEHAGRSAFVPALRGMPMLARLVAEPDTEVHALELVSGTPTTSRDAGDAGEQLDAEALTTYKRRVSELTERLEDLEERGDVDRAEAIRDELDTITRELSRAVGKGGRARRAGVAAERARISAQRRIREAIKRIADVDPELGEHLDRTVQTGTYCIYAPRSRKRS